MPNATRRPWAARCWTCRIGSEVSAQAAVAAQDAPFDHRESGTAEAVWAASGLLREIRPLTLDGLRRLFVVAAHPDDESLGAGGLIAVAAAQGAAVTVVVATTGEASHPDSPTTGPAELAALRRAEVRSAVARLAPRARVVQLELGDGRLAGAVDLLTAELTTLVGDADERTWLVAPWRDDRHPDHTAASQAAARVAADGGCRLLEYPLWAWHWARPGDGTFDPGRLVALDVPAFAVTAKTRALAEHRSQTEALSPAPGDEPVVPPAFREHFVRTREIFVDASRGSLPQGFFDEFYSRDVDPWGFRTRWYEKRKRAITLASLPRQRFASAFEPGCAIGVLTAELAPRCDHLLATDIAQAPLIEARSRLGDRAGVRFEQRRVPQDWPSGLFDLVVLSEIGYYCGSSDLSLLIESAASCLTPDGVLLACHWRHPVPDYPLTGDEVHSRLRRESGLAVLASHVEEDFLLDVLVREPGRSVARADGLLP
jgi:LmbE family N-acetylglucosaminyl deacetylase/SAM-dependent methyltransferase